MSKVEERARQHSHDMFYPEERESFLDDQEQKESDANLSRFIDELTESHMEFAQAERKRVLDEVRKLVEMEEELDGPIPEEMYLAIVTGDKNVVTEALRIIVRETKKSILSRFTELEAADD